ncbi:hypothetical protein C8039_07000 [Halogeometricum sp. wsp3]|nr:hypothetical protein C8039_07000 [Halogeometricum sp. wsp3]
MIGEGVDREFYESTTQTATTADRAQRAAQWAELPERRATRTHRGGRTGTAQRVAGERQQRTSTDRPDNLVEQEQAT